MLTPTYNMWMVNIANPTIRKYCSTVRAGDMQEAISKTIIGCDLKGQNLANWRWCKGNPRFNEKESELLRGFVSKQLG